jgi:hypothetical protein
VDEDADAEGISADMEGEILLGDKNQSYRKPGGSRLFRKRSVDDTTRNAIKIPTLVQKEYYIRMS